MFQPTRRALVAGAAACLAAPRALAAAAAAIPAQAFRDDLRLLQTVYEALHPGLWRYASPDETRARFDRAVDAVRGPIAMEDAYLRLSRLTAQVRCGHSQANPYNQSDAVMARLTQGERFVPFYFRWAGGRMIVTQAAAALPRGAEVMSINGLPARQLLDDLMPYSRADGANDSKRVANLEVVGPARWQAFDLFAPLVHPRAFDRRRAAIAFRPFGENRTRTTTVELVGHATRISKAEDERRVGGAAWQVERLADGTAWIAMPNWALYESKWDWRAAIDATMDRLAAERAPALVLDLRTNEGGEDVGMKILARMVERPTAVSDKRRYVRYRRTPDALNRHMDTWDKSFRDWGELAVPCPRPGFFRLTKWDDTPDGIDTVAPKGPRFAGRLAVITDPSNSSATGQFAEGVRLARLGTLVGRPTGGNQRGINGSGFFFLRLPGSGLEVDTPLVAEFADGERPDAGVTPDIAAPLTAETIARGGDPERDAVLGWLRS
jgi:peptidase S41-like protein